MTDLIDRAVAIDAIQEHIDGYMYCQEERITGLGIAQTIIEQLPSAQPEPHEIGYSECANSMLKMWIDNVLTDGEYSHIMDKLNAYWAERRTDERMDV